MQSSNKEALFELKLVHTLVDDVESLVLLRGHDHVLSGIIYLLNEISKTANVFNIIDNAMLCADGGIFSDLLPKQSLELNEILSAVNYDHDLSLYVVAEWFTQNPLHPLTANEILAYLKRMPFLTCANSSEGRLSWLLNCDHKK